MPSPQLERLIPALRIPIRPKHRLLKNIEGPYGRLKNLRGTVTALVRDERVEMHLERLDEARGYAERLIQDAIRHGDRDERTMDMANFWLNEKQLIHKLFKVLVPRYSDYRTSFTSLHKLPPTHMELKGYKGGPRGVLELKGNPYPPLKEQTYDNKNLLHNVLLDEARRQYRQKKYHRLAAAMVATSDKPEKQELPGSAIDGNADASTSDQEKPQSSEPAVDGSKADAVVTDDAESENKR